MEKKKSTGLLLSVLGVLSLVLITAGVTYAFFSYTKEGVTENTLTTGTITFYYDEMNGAENGIQISEALPMSDAEGMALSGANQYFDFKVISDTTSKTTIGYTVTARETDGHKNDAVLTSDKDLRNQIKLYLTATNPFAGEGTLLADSNKAATPIIIDELDNFNKAPAGAYEKVLYTGTIPANEAGRQNQFKLRMWIAKGEGADANTDYSAYEFVSVSKSTGTDALDAATLIASGDLITSEEYYKLPTTAVAGEKNDRTDYERIAYVKADTKEFYGTSQNVVKATVEAAGFKASEQLYMFNGRNYTVKVNVYATGATVVTE